jgi:hypothetical protein
MARTIVSTAMEVSAGFGDNNINCLCSGTADSVKMAAVRLDVNDRTWEMGDSDS